MGKRAALGEVGVRGNLVVSEHRDREATIAGNRRDRLCSLFLAQSGVQNRRSVRWWCCCELDYLTW